MQTVPTVADLRARRLDLTRAALRESLLGDELDRFRVVVETLADEFDLMEVALAAVKLAHEAVGGADDDEEIPQVGFRTDRDAGRGRGGSAARRAAGRAAAVGRADGAAVRRRWAARRGSARGDLVGAITGETGLTRPRHRRDRDPPAVRAGRGARAGRRTRSSARSRPP